MTGETSFRVADSAVVADSASIGAGCTVWDYSQVREGASIGANSIVGRNVYIDADVSVGANCKIQNNSLIYAPAKLEDGVFIGPGVILTNDRYPRAVNSDGSLKAANDWVPGGVSIGRGAAIGAGSVILAGVSIGAWALVAAGSVVIRDVPSHGLVAGNPAAQKGWVGKSGTRLIEEGGLFTDPSDQSTYRQGSNGLEEAK